MSTPMQNAVANTLVAARRSAAASVAGSSRMATTNTSVTRRNFSVSPSTQKAFFLDTLRKNHTPPTSTHTISGSIGNHVSSASDELEEPTRFLRMIMFGKPGAGKGTLAQRLVKKYDLVAVSTGDLLRQHIAERTDIGREAEDIVARGGLLPDEIVLKVVTGKLDGLRNKVRTKRCSLLDVLLTTWFEIRIGF